MPTVQGNGIDIYYEVQGEGEPMVLIPYLAADQACYAFQVAEYAKHYTCYSVDLRGAGLSGQPDGVYTTELFAADVAAFMPGPGRHRAGAHLRAFPRRGHRHVAGGRAPRKRSERCHCAAAGPPATRSCAPWWRAGRSSPRRWTACRK